MSDTATNPSFSMDYSPISKTLKSRILREFWDTYKDYPEFDFTDLISYGNKLNVYDKAIAIDVGLSRNIKQDESDVQEIYMMFLLSLGMDKERAFIDLEDIFVHREILLARGEIK